jgi:hypothetical protein
VTIVMTTAVDGEHVEPAPAEQAGSRAHDAASDGSSGLALKLAEGCADKRSDARSMGQLAALRRLARSG